MSAAHISRTLSSIARSSASAEETVGASLDRIEKLGLRLAAFATVDPERSMEAAHRLDALERIGVPRGPLFGVPLAVKDIIDVAGLPTGGGSLTRTDVPPAVRSAPIVERLEAAGAVVVGKTATVEYAFGGWGTNHSFGTPWNPWDMEVHRVPGGSSSGSGVAVAAGLVPLALGSDTGGSVRLPAGFCGIVGLKTTTGLVDKSGVLVLSSVLDSIGPLTATVADAALALSMMAHTDGLHGGPLDAVIAGEAPSLEGRRIGIVTDLGVELHPATRRVYEMTIGLLEDAGAHIVWIELERPLAAFAGSCGHYLAVESYMNFRRFVEEEPNRLDPAVRERMQAGGRLSAADFLATMEDRKVAQRTVAELFERVDTILTPTTAMPAPTVAEHDEGATPAVLTRFANFIDLAAVTLPMGLSDDGLPIGMQLNVPAFHEPRALMIAAAMEARVGGPIRCPLAEQA